MSHTQFDRDQFVKVTGTLMRDLDVRAQRYADEGRREAKFEILARTDGVIATIRAIAEAMGLDPDELECDARAEREATLECHFCHRHMHPDADHRVGALTTGEYVVVCETCAEDGTVYLCDGCLAVCTGSYVYRPADDKDAIENLLCARCIAEMYAEDAAEKAKAQGNTPEPDARYAKATTPIEQPEHPALARCECGKYIPSRFAYCAECVTGIHDPGENAYETCDCCGEQTLPDFMYTSQHGQKVCTVCISGVPWHPEMPAHEEPKVLKLDGSFVAHLTANG